MGHAAPDRRGLQVKTVPAVKVFALHTHAPAFPVPGFKAKRKSPMSDARHIGDERERVDVRRILSPALQDVAGKRVPGGTCPAGLNPWPHPFDWHAHFSRMHVSHLPIDLPSPAETSGATCVSLRVASTRRTRAIRPFPSSSVHITKRGAHRAGRCST